MKLCVAMCSVFFVLCGAAWAHDKLESPPQEVTYCQLAKDPDLFAGKLIRVRALYVYGFEVQMLKSPVCCSQDGPKIGVTFDIDMDDRSLKLFRKLDKGMGFGIAVFVGRFDRVSNASSQLPSGDRFQLTVDKLEKVERAAKFSGLAHGPAWAPTNCEAH